MRGSVAATILNSLLACSLIGVPKAAEAQTSATAPTVSDGCTKAVADLNGDGVPDYVASQQAANGAPIVYVLFRRRGTPATPDARYIKRHATMVLRGPAAMPFTCADDAIRAAFGQAAPALSIGAQTDRRATLPRADNPIGAPPSYTVLDLNPLMPEFADGFSSLANAINARGQVVGRFFAPAGDRAFVFDNGEVRDLGTLGGESSDARDINDIGEIAGFSLTGDVDNSGFVSEAFASDGHTLTGLGMRWSSAESINGADQIVGEMRIQPDVDLNHAFLYQQGFAADLGSLPPLGDTAHSAALAINEQGQVVGESDTFIPGVLDPSIRHFAVHPFLYENGAMHDVGSLGPVCNAAPGEAEKCVDQATATSINNSGEIVGFSTTLAGTHAFTAAGGVVRDLGTLGGSGSWAYGVNDSGQVVGGSLDDQEQFVPFLLDQGTLYNLNTLVADAAGSLPFAAYSINNFGQIAGNHHLLSPNYDTVAPGRKLSFDATVGDTLTFEYRAARGNPSACHAIRNRLRLQVKINVKGQRDVWMPVAEIAGCTASTNWQSVAIAIPVAAQNSSVNVRVRVRESGTRATRPCTCAISRRRADRCRASKRQRDYFVGTRAFRSANQLRTT